MPEKVSACGVSAVARMMVQPSHITDFMYSLTWLLIDWVVGGGVRALLTLPLGLKAMAWGGSL